MIIIGFTTIFTWVLTMQKVPQIVANFFIGLNMPAWGIALVFCVMILMITGLAIGLVTPPVGMCLNACNKINRMPIIAIFKGALPYLICNIIVLLAISLCGPLTTWLPQLLGYSL